MSNIGSKDALPLFALILGYVQLLALVKCHLSECRKKWPLIVLVRSVVALVVFSTVWGLVQLRLARFDSTTMVLVIATGTGVTTLVCELLDRHLLKLPFDRIAATIQLFWLICCPAIYGWLEVALD